MLLAVLASLVGCPAPPPVDTDGADTDSDATDTDTDATDTDPIDTDALADADEDGWTVGEGDCLDDDPTVHPGAEDAPGDGVEKDCDGLDRGAIALADVAVRIDGDGGFFGSDLAIGDLTGDGVPDLAVSAFTWGSYWQDGRVWVFSAPSFGQTTDSATATISPEEGNALLGRSIEVVDLDGSPPLDLLISQPYAAGAAGMSGVVHLLHGPITGLLQVPSDAEDMIKGERELGAFGSTIADLGDLDGDGWSEVAMSEPDGAHGLGRVYVFALPLGGSLVASDAATMLEVPEWSGAGTTMTAGHDVDGDGRPDVLLSATSHASSAGRAWLLNAVPDGNAPLDDIAIAMVDGGPSCQAGLGLDFAGDVDGNGLADVVVGEFLCEEPEWRAGRAALYLAPLSGSYDASTADAVYAGWAREQWVGRGVTGLGDWNGDGRDDFAISMPGDYYSERWAGMIGVFEDPLDQSWLDVLAFAGGWGDADGLRLEAGDLTGDGKNELVIAGDDQVWIVPHGAR